MPMREEIKNLNEQVAATAAAAAAPEEEEARSVVRRKRKLETSSGLNAVDQYHAKYDETKLDSYFSIQRTGENRYMIGDKVVVLDKNSNIYVGCVKYEGTPGLWALVMRKSPTPRANTHIELTNYKAINTVKPYVNESVKKLVGQKRPAPIAPTAPILPILVQQTATVKKKPEIDINSLIGGSGIVFD